MSESSAKLLRRLHKRQPALSEEYIFETLGETFRTGNHREKGRLSRKIRAMIARGTDAGTK